MATILPLRCAGEISAIYMGDNTDAIPTPAPAQNLEKINKPSVGAKAIPKEEIKKTPAAKRRAGLLPTLSEYVPANRHPAIAPSAGLPVANPSQYAFSPNCLCKKGSAPEITAKSNPNRYPPKADMNEMAIIFF